MERAPELEWLPMTSKATEWQMVSGIYTLENGQWRWMGPRAVLVVKPPGEARPAAADIYIPEMAPGRVVTLSVDGKEVARQNVEPGKTYRIASAPLKPAGAAATMAAAGNAAHAGHADARPSWCRPRCLFPVGRRLTPYFSGSDR